MTLSNEQLMWLSIGIWVFLIILLGYFAFSGGSKTVITPSGSTVDLGNLASTS
jgi:hypothetical protein